jgi:hypothetical protein
MKLTNTEQALWSVIEIAIKETGKTKAADAIKANTERIEATTDTHSSTLYKTPSGSPVFKATALVGSGDLHLAGFKLLQKAASVEEKAGGVSGGSIASSGNVQAKADSSERNRSVGLMRRKSG